MFCSKCGNGVSEDDRFCRKCGAKVSQGTLPPVAVLSVNDENKADIKSDNAENNVSENVTSASAEKYRTAEKDNKLKLILPLTILTLVLFGLIIALFVLINRPDTEINTKPNNRVQATEAASVEPETTTSAETTSETTTVTTIGIRMQIQDLALYSGGEIIADPVAYSLEGSSVTYHHRENDGDMYYYVNDWLRYLKNRSGLKYVGSAGNGIIYTEYFNCDYDEVPKKEVNVDGKRLKQKYVFSVVTVNDPDSNAVLSVTVNMAEGLEIFDLDARTKITTAVTTTTTATSETTTETTTTTSKNSSSQRYTETYIQDFYTFTDMLAAETDRSESNGITTYEYTPANTDYDITDMTDLWVNMIFSESDFNYVGENERSKSTTYYFDYSGSIKDKPSAVMDRDGQRKEYSLEITVAKDNFDRVKKVTVKKCEGIRIEDMGERY